MKLHFRKLGEGPPVIILHGLLGSSDNWQTFGKMLAESNYSVYMADLRNHGHSPHDPVFDLPEMADDIAGLMKDENLNNAVLIGHSLGGKTAMVFAFRYPQFVTKLIVVDIAPRAYPVHHRQILDALMKVPVSEITSRKEAETILANQLDDTAMIQILMKGLYRSDPEHFAWRFNVDAINRQIENVGKATYPEKPVSIPALFIRGENSGYVTNEDEADIKKYFLNATVLTAPLAGHWVHADNPAWLLDVVKKFLEENY